MVVGVSGMAKSNLFRHIARPEIREIFLGLTWQNYGFASTDVHALANPNEAGLYESILRNLIRDTKELGLAGNDLLTSVQTQFVQLERLTTDRELPQAQRAFLTAMDLFATNRQLHFVILLDQFDEIFPHLSARCFTTLRHLRDQLKYRLSYIVFTREDLSRRGHNAGVEEFTELLTPAVLWLGTYSREDAQTEIRRVAARYGIKPDFRVSDRLIDLTDGHSGLLKAAYQAVIDGRANIELNDSAISLLKDSNVQTECMKLWSSLTSKEQTTLVRAALGGEVGSPVNDTIEYLERKSLLTKSGGHYKIFCSLFADFLVQQASGSFQNLTPAAVKTHQGTPRNLKLRIETETRTAWLGYQELKLTPNEYKLLDLLYHRRGAVCSRDEIVRQVYSVRVVDPATGIDDSRVDTLVSRLRGKIKGAGGDPHIVTTVWGQGFKLENDE
ncbi:MAG: winged helix-turn-helix domain-containing protein [Anaerolineae bacterium]